MVQAGSDQMAIHRPRLNAVATGQAGGVWVGRLRPAG